MFTRQRYSIKFLFLEIFLASCAFALMREGLVRGGESGTRAQPIPPINHSQNIPAIRTPLKGLYFASMSQVYPWDRGTNYAVEIGRKTAAMVMADLSTNKT